MPIRILIADDHAIVAEGLKHLVEAQSDLQVVATVGDGRAAVRMAKETEPDVVLMDLSMPELNGADAARAIIDDRPDCKVIVLSMYAEREYVRRALKAGATGYVVKRSAAKELVEAIRAVHAGQRYLSPRVADVVIDDYAADGKADLLEKLSAREREVAARAIAEDGGDLPRAAGGKARHSRRRRPRQVRYPARARFPRLVGRPGRQHGAAQLRVVDRPHARLIEGREALAIGVENAVHGGEMLEGAEHRSERAVEVGEKDRHASGAIEAQVALPLDLPCVIAMPGDRRAGERRSQQVPVEPQL